MQEIDGKYSIKRKKLMKTTTLITLLVAATMILSGAVTGITMSMNEKTTIIEDDNTGGTEPLFISGIEANRPPVSTESNIGQSPVSYPYKSMGYRNVVWDNGMIYDDGWTAQTTQCLYDGEPADDFEFGQTTVVMDVHWLLIYMGGSGYVDYPHIITFFLDDGSGDFPGAVHAGPFTVDTVDVYVGDFYGWPLYSLEADIPAVVCDAGQRYWISIQADGPCDPRTFWAMQSGPGLLSECVLRSDYFTGGAWVTSTYNLGQRFNMCFQLTTKAEDDVGVSEIKHPTHGDMPGCPCIPVEVEVTNYGSNDQSDVEVNVEIHRSLMSTSFPQDDYNMEWNFDNTGAGTWQFVQFETSPPFAVTPAEGDWMAEFDQSSMIGGVSEMRTHYPINLCGECIDPVLKFYFWHDEYGSDDYMDVWVSTDGKYGNYVQVGGPYTRLCCPDCPTGWQEYRISLAEFICEDIWIMFVGHADGIPSAYNLFVDYVSVFDLEYQASTTIDIDAGETIQVPFDCWDATCWWCQYENDEILFQVGAWTEMEGDENPGNDGFGPFQWDFAPVWIYIPFTHDVGDKAILEPSEEYYMAGPIQMKQLIKNYGKEPEGCFNVYMSVEEIIGGTCFDEDFSGDFLPDDWTQSGAFDQSYTSYAGGSSPEARLYWGTATGSDWLMTPSCDTQGSSSLTLEFKTFIDYYTTSCYFYVEITPDGGTSGWTDITPWSNPIFGNIGPAPFTIPVDSYTGPDTQVRFRFSGTYWMFDYWYIDDVKLYAPAEYNQVYLEQVCVDDIGVCQELPLDFPDWTPEPPEPCFCGTQTYRICSWTKMLDPPDQNALNDKKCKIVTVEFLHDVGVKEFTSPEHEIGTVDFLGYHDGTTENAYAWTSGAAWQEAIQLTDAKLAPYRGDDITQVEFSCGSDLYGFYVADYEIWISDTLEDPTAPPVVYKTGTSSGTGWDTVTLNMAYEIPTTGDVYVGISFSNYGANWPAGIDTSTYVPEGVWLYYSGAWVDGVSIGLAPSVFGLSAGVTEGGNGGGDEVPDPDVYVPCEEVDICAMFENLGTYTEEATVTWTFFEYQPAKTELDSGSFVLNMGPMTQTEECLLTYDFSGGEGVYEIEVEIQLTPTDMDCDLANNGPINLVIGADCCGPESCFVLDPEHPDGENNWYVSDVEVTVDAWETCEVQSGIAEIVYIIDGAMDSIPGDHGVFIISGDGVHHGEVYAVDSVGNEGGHHTFEVAIDATEPAIDLVHEVYEDESGNYMIDFTATANDATSGMNRVEFKIDGVLDLTLYAAPYEWTVAYEDGMESKTFSAHAYDNAGNSASDSVTGVKTTSTTHTQSQTQSRSFVKQVVILTLGI